MRKFVSTMLFFIICFSNLMVFAENEDIRTQQKEMQEQVSQKQEEIEKLKIDMTENLEQIQKLDEKIGEAEIELNKTEKQAIDLKKEIDETEEILKKEQKKYTKQKETFEERIIAIYEAGEIQFLDVLLSSKNLSEFLSSYYVMSEIAETDKELLDVLEEKKKTIENADKRLKKAKEQMSVILERETRTSNILKTTKNFREKYIERLSEKERETQEKLEEYSRNLTEVNNQILELAMKGIDTAYIGGELAWPVPGYTRISSPYGMRVHPITHVYKLHTGVDISAPMGANFVAVNDGIVVKSEYNIAYGKMVVIDHGGGISTLYAHGSEILVNVGDTVKRNQEILKVGSTGYSTGPHAHFEVRKNGHVVDPMPYITKGIVPNSKEDDKKIEEENKEKKEANQGENKQE